MTATLPGSYTRRAFEEAGQLFPIDTPVTVDALVVLTGPNDMRFRDVDNLLKNILDALQGALADTPKAMRAGVITNDHLVWRATVEKRPVASDFADVGNVTIGPYSS